MGKIELQAYLSLKYAEFLEIFIHEHIKFEVAIPLAAVSIKLIYPAAWLT